MRFAVAGFSHEANTFAPLQADKEVWLSGAFLQGDEIRTQHEGASSILAGFLKYEHETPGIELVPLIHAQIMPTGASTVEAFDFVTESIERALRMGGDWDGILLAQHGAAVSEACLDADGEFVRRVREIVGPDIPIGVTLDLHANVSDALVDAADVITVFQTNPHVDAAEQGFACARMTADAAAGTIRPTMAITRLPLAINILRQGTEDQPMSSIMARAREAEKRSGALYLSVVEGFPYADVPEMGMSVVAVTDNDPKRAQTLSEEVAEFVWEARHEMLGGALAADDALRAADAEARGPVVVLDMGDNVGGGSPGDSTHLLHAARHLGVSDLAMSISDPVAVAECQRVGIGGSVELHVGGRTDKKHGVPFPVIGEVIALADGTFQDPSPTHGGQQHFNVGATAGVRTIDGFLLAIHSRPSGGFSRMQFTIAGIDPRSPKIVVVKGVHSPRAAFEPIASRMIWADTRGATSADLLSLDYECRDRPMFPYEPETQWSR